MESRKKSKWKKQGHCATRILKIRTDLKGLIENRTKLHRYSSLISMKLRKYDRVASIIFKLRGSISATIYECNNIRELLLN